MHKLIFDNHGLYSMYANCSWMNLLPMVYLGSIRTNINAYILKCSETWLVLSHIPHDSVYPSPGVKKLLTL